MPLLIVRPIRACLEQRTRQTLFMGIAVITGSAGLIGSEATRYFCDQGLEVIGIDNDMRADFFGPASSTRSERNQLESLPGYQHREIDIRNREAILNLFSKFGSAISLVIHTAAQPSHDWAARAPFTDFDVNAIGTLNLLEATRLHAPDSVFIFTSTNKVYGDRPNDLPLMEQSTRWELEPSHPYTQGIPESMPIDQTLHSLFGSSKVAADILVQEYGRYFGMKTACFRGGCLTGPQHAGAELHGFLAYLVKCALQGTGYTIYGHKGKQVRDNIHCSDLISAFQCFFQNPRCGEVYNIGGGRTSNCSLLEAIDHIQELSGNQIHTRYSDSARTGDHIWYISDVSRFQSHYPEWRIRRTLPDILREMVEYHRKQNCAI